MSACRSENLRIRSVKLSIVIPRGGVNLQIYPGKSEKWALSTGMSLYIPIIWLFRMGAHWALSTGMSLYIPIILLFRMDAQLPISTGMSLYIRIIWLFRMSAQISYEYWYVLIYSYYLTVSNGCSLTALSSVKFAQCSGSFPGGVNWQCQHVDLKIWKSDL